MQVPTSRQVTAQVAQSYLISAMLAALQRLLKGASTYLCIQVCRLPLHLRKEAYFPIETWSL